MVRFADILKRNQKREPKEPKREEPKREEPKREEPKREEPKREEPKPSEEIKLREKVEIQEKKSEEIYAQGLEWARDTLDKARKEKIIKPKGILEIIDKIIDRLTDSNQEMLLTLTQAQRESYPNYLPYHLINVSILSINLGLGLEYNRMKLLELGISAFLHDIGMVKVPQDIVGKPSRLLEEEFAEIKKHPGYALDMLQRSKEISGLVKEAIYQHHELLNGKGYPQGLKEDKICEYAKIIGLVNMYEALTSPRVYRDKLTPQEALALIISPEKRMTLHEALKTTLNVNGEFFVSEILKLFVGQMTIYPIGSFVQLNNNEVGLVVGVNKNFPMKPLINILFDSEGNRLGKLKTVDLVKSPLLYIKKAVEPQEYK
jgi:HD-GYP domain-containing protein (c-di-GMP phosphodiesterase class II)